MSKIKKIALALVLVGNTASASALPPIHEDPNILGGFYAIGLADEVRRNCPNISARLFRAYSYLKALENYARDVGYTQEDIDGLTANREEKQRLADRIRADLAARGAMPGAVEGYCVVGREEIASDSAAGRLLRGK